MVIADCQHTSARVGAVPLSADECGLRPGSPPRGATADKGGGCQHGGERKGSRRERTAHSSSRRRPIAIGVSRRHGGAGRGIGKLAPFYEKTFRLWVDLLRGEQ